MQHDREIREREKHKLCSVHSRGVLEAALGVSRQPSLHPGMTVIPPGSQDPGMITLLTNARDLSFPPKHEKRHPKTVPMGFKDKKDKKNGKGTYLNTLGLVEAH